MRQLQSHSWKTSDWIKTKSSVVIEGTLCDEYRNQKTGQIVYEAQEESKALQYDKRADTDNFGHLICVENGNNCCVTKIDGEYVCIVKYGTDVN